MTVDLIVGILTPFLGTALGAFGVFFLRERFSFRAERMLNGFAAGVMTAASVWSLLIPAIERSAGLGRLAFLPALSGMAAGFFFLAMTDRLLPVGAEEEGGRRKNLLLLAVTIHNLPEGMAVGAAYAGALAAGGYPVSAAFALSLGIAVQNLPEGAIVSMPLASQGRGRAFFIGVLSGAVEPVGAVLTLLAAGLITPALPLFLSFAAGTMLYVVTEELLPGDRPDAKKPGIGTVFFFLGFLTMMTLDVALG
ncbi:MAG: ZIP family metal transporter [Lachnospiraceae bacterium]|nr:ZIP family metal transporter [Lachnospiraceae bacterium]